MTVAAPLRTSRQAIIIVIAIAAMIMWLGIGTRQTFGLFLPVMSADLGWGREALAFALAIQNLLWGLAQPVAGVIADRYGSGRVIAVGGVLYGLGVMLMAQALTPLAMDVTAGLLVGIGLSATSFAVVLGAVGRVVPKHRQGLAFGIVSAGGSVGQFAMVPIAQSLLAAYGWQGAFVGLGAIALIMVPLALGLRGRNIVSSDPAKPAFNARAAWREAVSHRGYRLLVAGFFVCGFQVMFIAVHLPAYLTDAGFSAGIAATALAAIGFFNIFGSFSCGMLGDRFSKKGLLSALYLLRSIAIVAFVLAPQTPTNAIIFASAMGLMWLGTVPLTSGIVAQVFGVQYLGLLFGVVFLGHQVGSFFGVWLGGILFDATGGYTVVWWLAAALGVAAALIHWPIDERGLARPVPA